MSDLGLGFSFDFDEADEVRKFGIVPEGTYQVVVSDIDVNYTDKGDPMLMVRLTIEDNEEYEGQGLITNWYMPNKAKQEPKAYKKTLGFMKMRLEAVTGEVWSGSRQIDPFDLIGRRCQVEVIVKQNQKVDDNGQPIVIDGQTQYHPKRNEVTWWFPLQQQSGARAAQTVEIPGMNVMGGMTSNVPLAPPPVVTAPPTPSAVPSAVPSNGDQSSPAPSPQPTPTASEPTHPAPSTVPSAPEQPGEPDTSNVFRL